MARLLAILTLFLAASCDDARYQAAVVDETDLGADVADVSDSDEGPDLVDAGTPGGPVRFRLRNTGELPVYLSPVFRSDSWLGISILDDQGQQLILDVPCAGSCEVCEAVPCEPPEARVRQLLPGETLTLDWTGTHFIPRECLRSGRRVACADREFLPKGEYTARVCFSTTLEVVAEEPLRRKRDDTLAPAELGPQTCVDAPLTLGGFGAGLTVELEPAPVQKEFGYCGTSWSYDLLSFASFSGSIPPARAGGSVAIPMVLRSARPCVQFGRMDALVQDDGDVVLLGPAWFGNTTCEPDVYVHLLDPLSVGDWRAVIATLLDVAPEPQPFRVEACEACGCPEPYTVEIGGACDLDCDCAERARCVAGTCTAFCRSSLDCRGDWICAPPSDGAVVPGARRCRPDLPDQCGQSADCPPGMLCQGHPELPSRCIPDVDTRLIARETGRSFHCGCDAECPGAQSCVRFEPAVSDGFCALRCADDRDCPKTWRCLSQTAQGVEAICVP